MRGKAQLTIRDQPSDGITPAYAGKSESKVEQDKPKVGSPPPMRGKAHALKNLRN